MIEYFNFLINDYLNVTLCNIVISDDLNEMVGKVVAFLSFGKLTH